jgi:hypothetical protein
MSQMKEKPVPPKQVKTPHRKATNEAGERRDVESQRGTWRRIRKIVERHRKTFDELGT